MKTHRNIQRGLLVLAASLAALPGLASDDCDVPIHRWQSREAVMQMAESRGWDVSRLKIDDGCYEIRGTDAQGRRFKAQIDPETLQPVRMKLRDKNDDKDKERSRDRDREHRQSKQDKREGGSAADRAGPAPSTTSTPFTPGITPRGQIQ